MNKFIKLVLGSLAFCLCAFSVSMFGPQLHNDYLRYISEDSIVRVMRYEGGGGTGFGIQGKSGKSYIMTNKHVCDVSSDGYMVVKNGNKTALIKKIVYIDDKHDLCLLEGDKSIPSLKLGSELRVGEFNYIIGHPGLRDLTVFQGEYIGKSTISMIDHSVRNREDCKGEVVELNPFQQLFLGSEFACLVKYPISSLTTNSYPGNSGSPVLNKFGNVVGVLFAGSSNQERNNHAVPFEDIERVLSKF